MNKPAIIAAILILPLSGVAQTSCPELLDAAVDRLYEDVSYLASDDLQGRKPGGEGAELAARYIEAKLREIGLEPAIAGGYRQVFTIPGPVNFGKKNSFEYKSNEYSLPEDFFPVQWSSNASAEAKTIFVKYGITAPGMEYDDYKGLSQERLQDRIFVMDISSPDGIHPHSEYLKYHDLGERITNAREKGAAGVVLVNLSDNANDLSPNFKNVHNKQIPVVFVTNNELAEKIKKNKKVSFTTDISENRVMTSNLVGFLNNNAATTVIIGAHYDHLGLGAEGSLYSGEEEAIHNGADDNASGVAGMLELARNIKANPEKYSKDNYLFIAFSGEESGLLGSSFFTENMERLETIEPKLMINLDMIGRLEENQLAVNGTGTSPHWQDLIMEEACDELRLKTGKSGVGPSDHTNFYYMEIPVLHFFTGTHKDYHKPSDDVEKVNFEGEVKVLSYILSLLQQTAEIENFEFSATKNEEQQPARFTVTLGVMPDYMYEGEGMRIDGVNDGKPAAEAGLQAGDVVVQLGEVKVVDMMSYMKALGQFKKGDSAELNYKRGAKTFTTEVKF